MKPRFNHEGSGLKRTLARIGIAMGVLLLTAVSTFSQDYPPGKLWVTFWPGAFDSLETDSSGYRVYRLSYLDSVNIANQCSTIVSDSVAGLDSSKYDYMVYFPDTADIPAIADIYLTDPNVRYAAPDYYIDFLFTPDDPLFDRPGNTMECRQWGLDSLHCQFERAWDITKGDTGVVIAMIDLGIFYSHSDLADNLWINGPEDIRNPGTFEPWHRDTLRNGKYGDFDGIDQDGNGFKDDVVGWNFWQGDSSAYIDSVDGHGTITSSVASGVTNNGKGIAGAGYNCRLMLLTGIPEDTSQFGYTNSWALKCIRYAGKMGPDVVNMSWKMRAHDARVGNELNLLYNLGIVLVAAAGNDGGLAKIYPAGYPFVISVAGSDTLNTPHHISNRDSSVDLSAPMHAWGAYNKIPGVEFVSSYRYCFFGWAIIYLTNPNE